MRRYNFFIKGMVCESCEKLLKKELKNIEDISEFNVDFKSGIASVSLREDSHITIEEIFKRIEKHGYFCSMEKDSRLKLITMSLGLLVILVGGYFLLKDYFSFDLNILDGNVSLGILFVLGLFTGFHCIAMCGGFVVSYSTVSKGKYKPHILYGSGKLLSYTIIGAFFGFIGSIFTFTPLIRGIAAILAGLFLVIFGIGMLDIFQSLKKIRFKQPSFFKFKSKHPMVIGLLNGLMIACGPLQAMYIYAAGTSSIKEGALALLFFGLGTLPIMLLFGVFTSLLSSSFTKKILKISGVIVIVLGIIMLNRGLSLAGYNFSSIPSNQATGNVVRSTDGYQEIRMDVSSKGYEPNSFIIQKDVPVKWIINVVELNGCNNELISQKLGIDKKLQKGEQVIEFMPNEEGKIGFNCGMGMIRGEFIVQNDISEPIAATNQDLKGTCGMGGGCGCGMMM